MSDLSIIAHDYALNSEFARRFNDGVLTLKRVYLLGRKDEDSQRNVEKAGTDLRPMLESIVLALEDSGKPWSEEQAKVPADVIDSLRSRLKGELPDVVAQLRSVIEDLAAGLPLNQSTFSALDRVCEAADATASAAFRRLRRI
jgi:hypothetical protein